MIIDGRIALTKRTGIIIGEPAFFGVFRQNGATASVRPRLEVKES